MLEALARNMPSELYEEKKHYIEENSNNIELMVLGTSQITCSVNPDYLSIPSINMANGSQSFEYDYYLLDHYIDQLKNLQYVILELSYQSLYYRYDSQQWFQGLLLQHVLWFQMEYGTLFNKKVQCFHDPAEPDH